MAEIPEPFRAPVVYSMLDMDKIPVEKDLVYRQVDDQVLCMDVYRPLQAAPGERFPAVIFVHGDAPAEVLAHAKEWGQYTSWGRLAAIHGMVGVTFNHRSTQANSRMGEACEDVQAALAYVRANAVLLGIDPDRLCLWVCSAGGFKLKLALQENPAFIRCTVAYYPVLDLAPWSEVGPTRMSDEVIREFSAICHLSPQAAPMLLVRAGLDHSVLNAGIDRFVRLSLEQNVPLELYNHPTGLHGFDVRNPDERSRFIITRTLSFMRHHLVGES